MPILGKMLKEMESQYIGSGNREHLAYSIFNGEVPLPSFELITERKEAKPGIFRTETKRCYWVYVNPEVWKAASEYVRTAVEFFRARTSTLRERQSYEEASEKYLAVTRESHRSTCEQDKRRLGLANLHIGVVDPGMVCDIIDGLTLENGQPADMTRSERLRLFNMLKGLWANPVNETAYRLTTQFSMDFNPTFIKTAFNNPFLFMSVDEGMKNYHNLTLPVKTAIDGIILEYFRQNIVEMSRNDTIMLYLERLVPRASGEDAAKYLAAIAAPPKTEVSNVLSPLVVRILLRRTDLTSRITETLRQKPALAFNGNTDVYKEEYEDALMSLYRAELMLYIRKKLKFIDRPGEINFGPDEVSFLNRASVVIGYDVAHSTSRMEELGYYWPKFLSEMKSFIRHIISAYDGEYLNDMGDGQFYAVTSAKEAVLLMYRIFHRYDTGQNREELVDRTFNNEGYLLFKRMGALSATINSGKEYLDKIHDPQQREKILKVLEKDRLAYAELEREQELIAQKRKRLREDFPSARFTLVYGSYRMPQNEFETATGKAPYKLSRMLASAGKPGGEFNVEIAPGPPESHAGGKAGAQGRSALRHEGMIMTKEAWEQLRDEIGAENMAMDAPLTLALNAKIDQGSQAAEVYRPKDLVCVNRKGEDREKIMQQIYIACLGKADVKDYPGEAIYAVLSEREVNSLQVLCKVLPPEALSGN